MTDHPVSDCVVKNPLLVASVWLGGGLAYWWQWERRWHASSGRPDCPDLPDLPARRRGCRC